MRDQFHRNSAITKELNTRDLHPVLFTEGLGGVNTMIKAIPTRMTWYCLAVVVVLGCTTVTPHENFVNMLNRQVGENWTWLRTHHQFPAEETLINSRELPNGNVEKKYKNTWGFGRKRTCISIYEIDPKTEIIVRVGFEGTEEDCVINP